MKELKTQSHPSLIIRASTTPCWASAEAEGYKIYHAKRNSFPCYQQLSSTHTILHLQFSSAHHCLYSEDQEWEMHNLRWLHCNQLLKVCMQEHHHLQSFTKILFQRVIDIIIKCIWTSVLQYICKLWVIIIIRESCKYMPNNRKTNIIGTTDQS